MDNLPNYPFQQCLYEKCPKYDDDNNKFLIQKSKDGPFGIGVSYPTIDGYCPMTTPISLNKIISNKIISNKIYSEDIYARQLFQEFIKVFQEQADGWIFWNFKTESNFYAWNFISSYKMGYIQLNIELLSSSIDKIMNNYYVIFYCIGSLIFLFITLFIIFYLKYKKFKKNAYQYIDIEKMPLKYTKVNKIYVQENTIEI
jgi:hypothetical protein